MQTLKWLNISWSVMGLTKRPQKSSHLIILMLFFEHLKMQIMFVLKLYLTLLGVLNILEKNLGMNLSSCFGIIDVFSLTILWGTGFSNHSFLCILPLWQWKSLWTRVYTEYKFCFQIFFCLFCFIFFLTILEWIGEVVIESKPN